MLRVQLLTRPAVIDDDHFVVEPKT